jgi:3-hydroxyisobutyrate dehydrogenase
MGFGIAASLLRAGHEVCGADVDAVRVDELRARGGMQQAILDVASQLDAIVVVVLKAAQADAVLFGESGIVATLPKGAVVVCCVTIAPDNAREFARRCDGLGILYLDAPISGGTVKAAEGKLSVMASGSIEAFERASPILDATAETVFDLGGTAGAGSAMKAVNQMLAGTHIAAMAEALTFGMTQGIDPDLFLKVIPKCAGTSWMLENRAPHIADGDYAPRSAVDIWPKDLGIVLDIAKTANFSAPIATAALHQFAAAADMGLGREDDAAVAKVYARNSGLTLPGEN